MTSPLPLRYTYDGSTFTGDTLEDNLRLLERTDGENTRTERWLHPDGLLQLTKLGE